MSTKNRKIIEEITGEKITLGKIIKSIRLCRDMSQEEFGKLLGVSKQYLSNIEKDKKNISLNQSMHFAASLNMIPESFIEFVIENQLREIGLHNYEVKLKKIS